VPGGLDGADRAGPGDPPAEAGHPAATIDIISAGRLELGIGAGWNEEESGAYGIELGSRRERSDRFEEACQVLIGLLSQQTTDFDGRYYQLAGARCEPKGPQRPHPPICIGGSGERRTLRTTARYAQHWNFVGGAASEFARKRDVLYGHCRDVGRDPAEITLSSHVRLSADHDLAATVGQVTALAAEGLDLAIVYLLPPLTPPCSPRSPRRSLRFAEPAPPSWPARRSPGRGTVPARTSGPVCARGAPGSRASKSARPRS